MATRNKAADRYLGNRLVAFCYARSGRSVLLPISGDLASLHVERRRRMHEGSIGGVDLEEAYRFLDELRRSGDINMFGAAPALDSLFGCGRDAARKILASWMRTFHERTSNQQART